MTKPNLTPNELYEMEPDPVEMAQLEKRVEEMRAFSEDGREIAFVNLTELVTRENGEEEFLRLLSGEVSPEELGIEITYLSK